MIVSLHLLFGLEEGLAGPLAAPREGYFCTCSPGCVPWASVLTLLPPPLLHVRGTAVLCSPWNVRAEVDITFIWILTTFSLFVKHNDKVTFCLRETAYQTSHQGRMAVKGTHIFFLKREETESYYDVNELTAGTCFLGR